MLEDMIGGELTPRARDADRQLRSEEVRPAKTAGAFAADTEDDRRRLLFLVAAVNDADEEVDFAEDEYLRDAREARSFLPAERARRASPSTSRSRSCARRFEKVRKGPPPPPKHEEGPSVDVDIEAECHRVESHHLTRLRKPGSHLRAEANNASLVGTQGIAPCTTAL